MRWLLYVLCPLLRLLLLPIGSAAAAQAAAPAAAPQQVVVIGNGAGVQNGPSAPSTFTTTQPWHVVQIITYHWNDAKGTSSTGTIRLKGLGGAKSYGPFTTAGTPGQGGVPNANWVASVSFDLPPGRYQFVDSSPATWAQNEESGHRGMAWIMATSAEPAVPSVTAYQRSGIVHPGSSITLGSDLKGPLSFCVWAENAAGDKSGNAPRSACKFVSLLVDIARVSNGCGGDGWPSVVAAENYFGNTSTYTEPEGGSYTVSFVPACNLHDAGYGGQTVADVINGGIVDTHAWSRRKVDDKFENDMRAICHRRVPPSAKTALQSCLRDGRRYLIVRTLGMNFYDYDLTRPGTQGDGPRDR